MHANLLLGIFLALTLLISCGKDEKTLEEVSGVQGQEAAKKQIEEENRNLAVKAELMESELKQRVDFYLALVGDYEGEINLLGNKSKIELSIQPDTMPLPTTRIRTLEEITNDLNQVSVSILLKHYASGSKIVSVSCRINKIKPNINSGSLSLSSEDCPNFYQLYVSENLDNNIDIEVDAQNYSWEIYNSTEKSFPYLRGMINPGATPGTYEFVLKRQKAKH